MKSLKQIAQETSTLSKLMQGREKMSTEELLDKDITIIQFDSYVNTESGEIIYVFATREHLNNFTFAGAILKKYFMAFEEECKKENVDVNDYMVSQGGLKVRLTEGKTKQGRSITNVVLL